MTARGVLRSIARLAVSALRTARRPTRAADGGGAVPGGVLRRGERGAVAQASRGTETLEVRPEEVGALRLAYAPGRDGAPDAGEIVWTWVPYAEGDGRGKDRPVLIIARHGASRAYAVKLTSRPRDGDREFLALGAGPWDAAGRSSWVDLDQLYSVHVDGVRREASALDRDRYARVAAALQRRHGWGTTT